MPTLTCTDDEWDRAKLPNTYEGFTEDGGVKGGPDQLLS